MSPGRKKNSWSHWSRIRHLRGHGIHSPFVYSLMREAIIVRKVLGDGGLYGELIERGVRKKAARQLNNLHVFCSSPGYRITEKAEPPQTDVMTIIIKPFGDFERMQKNDRLVIENRFFFVIFDSARLPKQHFKI